MMITQIEEVRKCLLKISEFCPPDNSADQLDESPEMQIRLHNAEVGDTARAAIAILSELSTAELPVQGEADVTVTKTTTTVYSPKSTEVRHTSVDYRLDENLPDGTYQLFLAPTLKPSVNGEQTLTGVNELVEAATAVLESDDAAIVQLGLLGVEKEIIDRTLIENLRKALASHQSAKEQV
jgi:hypothetical protein